MNISVGQIVYLLSNRDIRVYPAQVIEEINRKTLSGSETSYVIKLPDKKLSEVHISQIDAEIFTSADELEEKMIENAKNKIRALIESATELENVFDDVIPPVKEDELLMNDVVEVQQKKKRRRRRSPSKKKDEKVEIDLGNGLTGKIDANTVGQIGASSE